MNAKQAKKLSEEYSEIQYTKLSDVLNYIKSQAKTGHTNTFIDGSVKDLEKFQKALEKRGFRVFIETYNPPTKFLSVEW